MAGDTRARLLAGALETLRVHGIAGVSARSIASAAGVNQALIFYHFGSVDELLTTAIRQGAEDHVARYRARLGEVRSLRELLDLGRELYVEETAAGDIAVLGQMLAGGQTDERLAPATAAGLGLWVTEIEKTLDRVLADTPLAEFADAGGLARAVAASFVGIELYGGVDGESAGRALDSLEQLAMLVEVLDDMGPVVRRAVRGRLRKAARREP